MSEEEIKRKPGEAIFLVEGENKKKAEKFLFVFLVGPDMTECRLTADIN